MCGGQPWSVVFEKVGVVADVVNFFSVTKDKYLDVSNTITSSWASYNTVQYNTIQYHTIGYKNPRDTKNIHTHLGIYYYDSDDRCVASRRSEYGIFPKDPKWFKGFKVVFFAVFVSACACVSVCLCACGWVGGWMYACACMLYVSMMGGGYSEMYTAM